jgi:hypothetical protein
MTLLTRAVSVERVTVGEFAVVALIRIPDRSHRRLSGDASARKLIEILPGLTRHSCENGSAHGILAELTDTETAHALEHVALEIMAQAGSPRELRGRTEWDFVRDGDGVFQVTIEYERDDVAVGSLSVARDLLEWTMGVGEPVDLGGAIALLGALRA